MDICAAMECGVLVVNAPMANMIVGGRDGIALLMGMSWNFLQAEAPMKVRNSVSLRILTSLLEKWQMMGFCFYFKLTGWM